ncbi:MAG: hypothetical protein ACF787_08820 [Rhodopirellula sp. JB053]|uniref:hypothetical protein n=1 Tax=Rhodopirellula sp. JB044 TaxID=3342844 RepID=UPI00370C22DC
MKDPFVQSQWQELCEHLKQVAQHLGERAGSTSQYADEAAQFCASEPPDRYSHLLDRVREAAHLAIRWQDQTSEHRHDEDLVDEAGEESFPASDPPVFSHSHA